MTTTIVPSSGAGVLFTQQGVGSSPGYSALDLRRSDSIGAIQEGVYAAGDYMVTQRAAGANMSVDIAAGGGAFAAVQGDSTTGQGLYVVGPHSATINEAVAASNPTNPRIDSVILEVQDNVHDASGGNLARVRVLTGTATGGATLANRNGAAALPGSALLLADLLVTAAGSSVSNTQIRDRRKWARGYRFTGSLSDFAWGTGTLTVVTGSQVRAELSGAPIVASYKTTTTNTNATADRAQVSLHVDSSQSPSVQGSSHFQSIASGAAGSVHLRVDLTTVSPGSHLLDFRVARLAGANYSDAAPIVVYDEIVRQNTANNATTSG